MGSISQMQALRFVEISSEPRAASLPLTQCIQGGT